MPNSQTAMSGIETFRGVAYPWHCDSMGHMNTQFYSALFDGATLHALAALASGAELAKEGLGWADVKQLIEYKHEVASGTLLVVTTSFLRLGTTSVSYLHSLKGLETGDLHATSEQTTVLFDLKQRKAAPLSQAMRARVADPGSRA
jgi:acyl-CoA thioester hydrolase